MGESQNAIQLFRVTHQVASWRLHGNHDAAVVLASLRLGAAVVKIMEQLVVVLASLFHDLGNLRADCKLIPS